MEYPWYQKLNKGDTTLEQGDFIPNCPIFIPPHNLLAGQEIEVDVNQYNVLILTQSCDLENNKVEIVLVCPYLTFDEFISTQNESWQSKKGRQRFFDNMKQGAQPSYHLLNKEEKVDIHDYLVVDFRNVYGVHVQFLQEYVKTLENRIRLLPPYKEHLSQSFARFFMRVGLPFNITPLEK